MLEEQVNGDGSIEWHDYIGTAAGLAGEYWSSNESGAPAPKTLYFYSDAQGTISAISGSTSEQDSYDPFGKQQNTNGSSDATCSLPSGDAQSRGWIGEEKLPSGCLVNLNARLYDPLTAHFLGPDSQVGQPFSTQGWNRYSYAGNNPMSFSDPTGMCFLGCFWKGIFGDVAAIAAAIVLDQWVLPAVEVAADIEVTATTQTFINAGITGAAQGAISTGTLKGTLLSAASALTQAGAGYLGQNLAAGPFASFALHGTAGGLSSVLRGGQFPSGFLAAGFSDLAGTYLQIPGNGFASTVANATVNAVIGGLGSILGGGKFENGAVTATFQYLFSPSTIGAAIDDLSSDDGSNGGGIGGDGAPGYRFTRDANGNLVYSDEYSGPYSDCGCLVLSNDGGYYDPRDGGTTFHGGIDLAPYPSTTDADSLSVTSGTVVNIGASGFGPYAVTVLTPEGNYATYGHLASENVLLGDPVSPGDLIGTIGTMGNSTGIHLHFQITTGAMFGPNSRFLGVSGP